MINKIYANPDIYSINIPLPKNPLRYLNSYVIKTKDKNLIIDTGFNLPECYEAMISGLNELEIDVDKTDIFLTHLHADHTGLITSIIKKETTVYMSEVDYEYLVKLYDQKFWEARENSFLQEGFDVDELSRVKLMNPAKIFNSKTMFSVVKVRDNYKFSIGEHEFTCIDTPGHTPGNMCLYMENEKILFSGDHILFDISPNITRWYEKENSLKDYLDSLEKVKKLDIKIALPAHRKNGMDVYERIDMLIQHHNERLVEVINIINSNPGLHAYDIAGKMKWSTKNKSWVEMPASQKWFAVGEALAHLDYLIIENKVYREMKDNKYYYYIK